MDKNNTTPPPDNRHLILPNEIDIGGIPVVVNDKKSEDHPSPSVDQVHKELNEGGIEIISGNNNTNFELPPRH